MMDGEKTDDEERSQYQLGGAQPQDWSGVQKSDES